MEATSNLYTVHTRSHPLQNELPSGTTDLVEYPKASTVLVTPELAEVWLSRNDQNRAVRRLTVSKFARDMAAGNWQVTGESIKFTTDGELLDGQHRLAAVVKSGASVWMDVRYGIRREAQAVMDSGRARTAADALTMSGEKHGPTIAAAARLALGVAADAPNPGAYSVTHAEVARFVEENPDLRQAAEFAKHVARRVDCPDSVVAYTCLSIGYAAGTEAAHEFWTAAAEKVGLKPGDPVIALTNRFAEARRNREVLTKRIYLSLIYRAWNARRADKTMRFIRVNSPAGGLVPIPDIHA